MSEFFKQKPFCFVILLSLPGGQGGWGEEEMLTVASVYTP